MLELRLEQNERLLSEFMVNIGDKKVSLRERLAELENICATSASQHEQD